MDIAGDGDPDPISAGTAGEAARWGGSSAVVGMAANPFGAHQAGPNMISRTRPADRVRPGAFTTQRDGLSQIAQHLNEFKALPS
jgi:hypothetical protein